MWSPAQGEEIHAELVILTAGAYFTPGILMRSGYGDEAELSALGIPVRHHLPGVGKNLLDHPLAVMVMQGALVCRARNRTAEHPAKP